MLVVLIGRSTRLSRYVTPLDKFYTATARFGAVSDTLDAEGEITPLDDAPMPDEATLRSASKSFTGNLQQTPPMASALKVGGVRLYDLHRRGLAVDREPRPITVHSFSLTHLDPVARSATFDISCSGGTYVRTLISDLAVSLNTGAFLTDLRRTRVGDLTVHQATSPEGLTPETLRNRIIQPTRILAHLRSVDVGGEAAAVRSGRALALAGVEGSVRMESEGELLAVYRGDGKVARAEVVLCGG